MAKLSELETRFATNDKTMVEMLDSRDTSGQEFTDEQKARFTALGVENKALKADIALEKDAEDLRKQKALNNANKPTPEQTIAKKVSIARAVRLLAENKPIDGAEGEISKEADTELKASGVGRGINGVGLPSWMVNIDGKNVHRSFEQRDLTSGGSTTGTELVENIDKGHIEGLTIRPKVIEMGATVLQGLTSNIYFTTMGEATAVWETENSAADETTPATGTVALTPKRLAAFTDVSKTLITQTGGVAETLVKQALERAVNRALDLAAINGSGASGQPLGILNFTGAVNSLALGANGDFATRENLIALWALIMADNADVGSLGWLTTPGMAAYFMNTNLDVGSGRFIWENNGLLSYPAMISNNVPANLTKGAGTNLHALILGVWDQLLIGHWGGIDITVNPYTRIKENIIEVVINSNWDIDARHEESFAFIKDAQVA